MTRNFFTLTEGPESVAGRKHAPLSLVGRDLQVQHRDNNPQNQPARMAIIELVSVRLELGS
jgi:hypothetical protein